MLDDRLQSRGIGGQPLVDHDNASSNNYPDAPDNQYSVIEWGSNENNTNEATVATHVIHTWDDEEWTDAEEAATTIESITGSGGNEDGLEAIHFAGGYTEDENAGEIAVTAELGRRGPDVDTDLGAGAWAA